MPSLQFLSPQGLIVSSWRLGHEGAVSFNVTLPIGVRASTIVVPKPVIDGKFAARAVIREQGAVVWDGEKLVGSHSGILLATDWPEGVEFATTNGVYTFESQQKAGRSV